MTSYDEIKLRTLGVLLGRIAVATTTRRKIPLLCRAACVKPGLPASAQCSAATAAVRRAIDC